MISGNRSRGAVMRGELVEDCGMCVCWQRIGCGVEGLGGDSMEENSRRGGKISWRVDMFEAVIR